jgi:hypothetical protein
MESPLFGGVDEDNLQLSIVFLSTVSAHAFPLAGAIPPVCLSIAAIGLVGSCREWTQ